MGDGAKWGDSQKAKRRRSGRRLRAGAVGQARIPPLNESRLGKPLTLEIFTSAYLGFMEIVF